MRVGKIASTLCGISNGQTISKFPSTWNFASVTKKKKNIENLLIFQVVKLGKFVNFSI